MPRKRMEMPSSLRWHRLGAIAPTALGEARETLHHAAQLLALVGASYIPPRADDSHTSMTWLDERGALATELVDAARPFRVGLRVSDLTILLLDAANGETAVFPLAQRTRDESIAWLRAQSRDAPFFCWMSSVRLIVDLGCPTMGAPQNEQLPATCGGTKATTLPHPAQCASSACSLMRSLTAVCFTASRKGCGVTAVFSGRASVWPQ